MITLKGQPSRPFQSLTGEITLTARPVWDRKNRILLTPQMDMSCLGYKACITSGTKGYFFHPDHVYDAGSLESLHDGDIVRIEGDGRISVLWEKESTHNAFMLTESCTCRCLMCPQPPRRHNPLLVKEAYEILALLKNKTLEQICITGGEPTCLQDTFLQFLQKCIQEHPSTHIDILTNGKAFSDDKFTKKVAQIATDNVCFCVSMHSDIDTIHDYIVGTKGSFIKTQQGLYNLAEYGCIIELRHVITRKNAKRLSAFAEHIYNYLPFCSHYAFMGMEVYGHAAQNIEAIYASPHEYTQELCEAVLFLHRRGLPVSIYNIPLCLCAHAVRQFARQSISTWKNAYLDVCKECTRIKDCAGFFTTSISLPINHIHPIKEAV